MEFITCVEWHCCSWDFLHWGQVHTSRPRVTGVVSGSTGMVIDVRRWVVTTARPATVIIRAATVAATIRPGTHPQLAITTTVVAFAAQVDIPFKMACVSRTEVID